MRLKAWFALALSVLTVGALASVGGVGIYVAPLLLPLHFVMARNAQSIGPRIAWAVLAAATAAESVWGMTYLLLGEDSAGIWLLPLLGACVAGGVALMANRWPSSPLPMAP